jgi:CRISPR-associated endonuclease/helicase Cas3
MASSDNAMLKVSIGYTEIFVELSCPVKGGSLPADHGYALYSALVQLLSQLHQQEALKLHQDKQAQILTIGGIPDKEGEIVLSEGSRLRIRVPVSKIPLVYPIAGKSLQLGKHQIHIGIPEISTLQPAPTLKARIVTIKNHMEPQSFLTTAQRQLEEMGIRGNISIPLDCTQKPARKTIKIRHYTIVGFTTQVSDLNDEDSLKLQQWGLGGKRKMGCGYFMPVK